MEPKKKLKRHNLTEPKWGPYNLTQEELISRINEASTQIHRNTTTGPANWVIMGSHAAELLDEALSDYDRPNSGVFYTGTTQEGNEPWRHL